MNKRVAKKILAYIDEFYVDEHGLFEKFVYNKRQIRQAIARMRRYRMRSVTAELMKMSRRVANALYEGDAASAWELWGALRPKLMRFWISPSDDTYQYPGELALERLSRGNWSLEDFAADVGYYSDRWCGWRVFVVDQHFSKLGCTVGRGYNG